MNENFIHQSKFKVQSLILLFTTEQRKNTTTNNNNHPLKKTINKSTVSKGKQQGETEFPYKNCPQKLKDDTIKQERSYSVTQSRLLGDYIEK